MDQAKYLVGNEKKIFCNRNNLENIGASVNYRAIGLLERLIQTIKNRLAYIKEEKKANNLFQVKHAIKITIH